MSNFEFCLREIADDIRNPNDSTNANDFFAVKDYVLSIMRNQGSYFRKICQNDILFGKRPNLSQLYVGIQMDLYLLQAAWRMMYVSTMTTSLMC